MSATAITSSALEQFRDVAAKIKAARELAEERAKANHERFNVFTTLLRAHDEVRLHTRFLHSLLDPKGTHDCNALFLNLFFATLTEIPVIDHKNQRVPFEPPQGMQSWNVKKESPCTDGQIDLLLELEQPRFGIAIENKIYAAEQKDQLSRYAGYLSTEYGPAAKVIYLTLDGKPSVSAGTNTPYVRISYAKHVLDWLERCLRATTPNTPIYHALRQYRGVVGELTGNFLAFAAMNPIIEFVRQNPDVVRYRAQLNEVINTLRADLLDRLADGISAELRF